MDLRPLSPAVSTAPMIEPADMAALAAEGFTTVVCNRPDAEVPPTHQAGTMERAAAEAGLHFVYNPVTTPGITVDAVDEQRAAIDGAEGRVMLYCRSGTRSAILWALAEAGRQPTGDILAALERAGYPMPQLGAQIDALAAT
ncbi:TIGR01244 family sulfur transferase [Jannaschia sp. W003]|uniref:TIGR01244 family sulfur transferase n=1 Tax=Jannaschia sp. W003 TaxID=2867012 RepID=UPI0021A3D95E|nr:TIGR01244 family sulfur transferase [Jannaschia sp. W003]UWQ20175.1 TIGR01244 family phosphatase [Jannaschia sp. W003]